MRLTRVLRKNFTLDDIKSIRAANVHPSVQKVAHFRNPILVKNASMQWIYDTAGKKYLDMFGGIVTVGVGHCHPKVNDALMNQANKLWHTTNIYWNEPMAEYCAKLASTFPGNLKVVYLVNSGSEANDLAIMMARVASKNFELLSLRNSYHGMSPLTMGLTAHSTWKQNTASMTGIHHVMNADVYKGLWGGANCRDSPVQTDRKCNCDCSGNTCGAGDKYLAQLDEVLTYSMPQKKVGGFFIESIQGVGGVVQFPKGFVKKAFDLVRQNGGVCISDEVQTGFARTGDNFWHFMDHGVVPDIVTLAKSIGNGFPMAAVVTTPEIAQAMTNANHLNTFGGNLLASAVGKAVLEVIEEEKLQANAKNVGTYFLTELANLKKECRAIGDVRGKGLMIGIEMVEDKETRVPLKADKMLDVFEDIKDAGVLIGRGGHFGNVFRLAPALCINKGDVDLTLDVFRKVLKKHFQ